MSANQSNTAALQQIQRTGTLVGVDTIGSRQGSSLADPNPATADRLPVLHLLILDEDDAVRKACAEIAGRMGFAVVTARNLDAARPS